MARRKLRDADDARRCLDEAAASGLSQAEWAKENGVDGRSLNAWRLNLERAQGITGRPRLVELVSSGAAASESSVYVVRCGEFSVEVDGRFDDEVLRRLLGVLASC